MIHVYLIFRNFRIFIIKTLIRHALNLTDWGCRGTKARQIKRCRVTTIKPQMRRLIKLRNKSNDDMYPWPCRYVSLSLSVIIYRFDRWSVYMELVISVKTRERWRDLTQSYDKKKPYTHSKTQKATWQHKNATKKLRFHNDYGPT